MIKSLCSHEAGVRTASQEWNSLCEELPEYAGFERQLDRNGGHLYVYERLHAVAQWRSANEQNGSPTAAYLFVHQVKRYDLNLH